MHYQLLYSYHIQCVQGLKNTNFLPRLTFCQQTQQSALDRQFLNNVLFADEAGIFSFHNCHMWAAVSPSEVKLARHQQSFLFNVRVRILGDLLIGPHFLPHRMCRCVNASRCGLCMMVHQHISSVRLYLNR